MNWRVHFGIVDLVYKESRDLSGLSTQLVVPVRAKVLEMYRAIQQVYIDAISARVLPMAW